MLQIGNTIVSRDLFDKKFVCDISCCKGSCCVEGDGGAPLSHEECLILENEIEKIKPYMNEVGIATIEDQYLFIYDQFEDEPVTPLVDGKECAYVYWDGATSYCAIEKAFLEGKIDFQKPISCHLYPIRTKKYETFEAVNYHQWSICHNAIDKGKENGVLLFEFLKEPLIRKYGQAWYDELVFAGTELNWTVR